MNTVDKKLIGFSELHLKAKYNSLLCGTEKTIGQLTISKHKNDQQCTMNRRFVCLILLVLNYEIIAITLC